MDPRATLGAARYARGHEHTPDVQRGDTPGQTRPHMPQFMGSSERVAQRLVQKVVPLGHAPQTPLLHDRPEAQAFPHAPQFMGSAMTEVQ